MKSYIEDPNKHKYIQLIETNEFSTVIGLLENNPITSERDELNKLKIQYETYAFMSSINIQLFKRDFKNFVTSVFF